MDESILTSTKKILGIDELDESFDLDILVHINSVFTTLSQLGIGPIDGFIIEDAASTWDDFIGVDPHLSVVKTYTYLRVRLLFDPPQTSFLLDALKEQIREIEWRINTYREETAWTPAVAALSVDGGNADGS